MTRQEAILMFGSVKETATAIGISKAAVYQWPDELSAAIEDRVLAAKWREQQRENAENDEAAA